MTEAKKAAKAATEATKVGAEQFESMITAMTENTEAMRDQTQEVFETVRENMQTAQERFQAVNADLMDAARQEMAEAVDFANELGKAKTVADALEIQRDYWTNLFETRAERTRKITETSVETAREAFEPFNKSMASFTNVPSFEQFFPFAAFNATK